MSFPTECPSCGAGSDEWFVSIDVPIRFAFGGFDDRSGVVVATPCTDTRSVSWTDGYDNRAVICDACGDEVWSD